MTDSDNENNANFRALLLRYFQDTSPPSLMNVSLSDVPLDILEAFCLLRETARFFESASAESKRSPRGLTLTFVHSRALMSLRRYADGAE